MPLVEAHPSDDKLEIGRLLTRTFLLLIKISSDDKVESFTLLSPVLSSFLPQILTSLVVC